MEGPRSDPNRAAFAAHHPEVALLAVGGHHDVGRDHAHIKVMEVIVDSVMFGRRHAVAAVLGALALSR